MEIYLVGGAVRDKLLGIPPREKDWVVVGATPEAMLKLGFRPVGKDFPVFLHPNTHEEYALARTERKTAPGYKGFVFSTAADITLESDLQRRDLTINAIAEDPQGRLIDPCQGLADLRNRILRHVSHAFTEDPVRILRVARLQARYARLGFQIARETCALMQQMVNNGEANALVAERVWKEMEKALQETSPSSFFEVLHDCGALNVIFPETVNTHRTEALSALTAANQPDNIAEVRFAAWAYALGESGICTLCKRLNAPKSYQELALLVARYQKEFRKCVQLTPPDLLNLLKTLDAFRRPERFTHFLTASEAVLKSTEQQTKPYPEKNYLLAVYTSASSISARQLTKIHLQGLALAEELDIHRRAAISKVKRPYRWAKTS